ncbi:hypothetical protein M0R45_001297 [Rubus argutus]|uniref:Uncharacterized protein n=1 Tax=Rubus argutus TaxID=59490 RepID=A0AAW1VI10_RUBAR
MEPDHSASPNPNHKPSSLPPQTHLTQTPITKPINPTISSAINHHRSFTAPKPYSVPQNHPTHRPVLSLTHGLSVQPCPSRLLAQPRRNLPTSPAYSAPSHLRAASCY